MSEKVDLRCYPYRGILTEMAKEVGMPLDQLHKALFKSKSPRPDFAAMFDKKLKERHEIVKSFKKTLHTVV